MTVTPKAPRTTPAQRAALEQVAAGDTEPTAYNGSTLVNLQRRGLLKLTQVRNATNTGTDPAWSITDLGRAALAA